MVQKNKEKEPLNSKSKNLLDKVIEFKDWIDNRTYIKGDIERIETWVENLNILLRESLESQTIQNKEERMKTVIQDYKSIPVNFLDEKTRIALNKKLKGICFLETF